MIFPFLWIVIVGAVVCFLVACGNGANDLANAFGTSYGSRVLTLMQIIVLATCCEFAGAVGLGSNVATTMSGGIAKASTFEKEPYVLMYGFLCTLGATFIWLLLATKYNLTVSSHHSVAGGIIGFALVYGGGSAVIWAGHKSTFPFVAGVVPIVVSWFISPLLTGIVAAIIYSLCRFLILERKNAKNIASYAMPVVVGCTVFLEFFFIFMIAASSKVKWSMGHIAWMAAVVGGGAGLLSIGLVPVLRMKIRKIEKKAEEEALEEGITVEEVLQRLVICGRLKDARLAAMDREAEETLRRQGGNPHPHQDNTTDTEEEPNEPIANAPGKSSANGQQDRYEAAKLNKPQLVDGSVVRDDEDEEDYNNNNNNHPNDHSPDNAMENQKDGEGVVAGVEQKKKKKYGHYTFGPGGIHFFDPRAEYMFRFLQIFTAACTSLAHGSNDVSNSIGPFAAIYNIYRTQKASNKADIPVWLLCIGGAGIVVGLATYGLNIMRLLGEKLAIITPVRGFSAELATALVVCFASTYGIPVSSTHCITGAVLAISWMDMGTCGVKWMLVLKMYAGWIMTLVITGVMSACFFAQGINSPSRD